MTLENVFDLVVIGAGPGGYAAAIRGAQRGLKVALIEKKFAGGVCLNEGCIPSKIWLDRAHLLGKLKAARELGILSYDNLVFHPDALQNYMKRKITALRSGIEGLERANGVTFIKGSARIVSADDMKRVEVRSEDGEKTEFSSRYLIIATGARPRVFDWALKVYDGIHVLTYEQVLFLDEVPKTLVVIGGGAVGLETADDYAALGSDVHVLEAMPSILASEDHELIKILARALEQKGIKITTGAKVLRVSVLSDGKGCEVEYQYEKVTENEDNDEKSEHKKETAVEILSCEKVLLATGVTPHVEGLGLAEVGIAQDKAGFIEVNPSTYETNARGVYAIGDVARGRFAHEAEAQGSRVVELITNAADSRPLDSRFIPACVFTDPQIGSFGFKEDDARAQRPGHDIRVGKARYEQIGRGISFNDKGLVKIVIDYCCSGGEILGAHVVGPAAEYLITILFALFMQESNMKSLRRVVWIHPTLPEVLKEAIADVDGSALHVLPKKKN